MFWWSTCHDLEFFLICLWAQKHDKFGPISLLSNKPVIYSNETMCVQSQEENKETIH